MDNPEEKQIVNETVNDFSSEEKKSEQGEICFICHEAAKTNKTLVYLAHIYKDESVCGAIYGDQSKSNTAIATCSHTVHAHCYIEMDKENVKFNCPECHKTGHCILPASLEDKNLNRICEKVMNVSMMIVHNVYNQEENFMLLFKHLLQSKGLSSMIFSA